MIKEFKKGKTYFIHGSDMVSPALFTPEQSGKIVYGNYEFQGATFTGFDFVLDRKGKKIRLIELEGQCLSIDNIINDDEGFILEIEL